MCRHLPTFADNKLQSLCLAFQPSFGRHRASIAHIIVTCTRNENLLTSSRKRRRLEVSRNHVPSPLQVPTIFSCLAPMMNPGNTPVMVFQMVRARVVVVIVVATLVSLNVNRGPRRMFGVGNVWRYSGISTGFGRCGRAGRHSHREGNRAREGIPGHGQGYGKNQEVYRQRQVLSNSHVKGGGG